MGDADQASAESAQAASSFLGISGNLSSTNGTILVSHRSQVFKNIHTFSIISGNMEQEGEAGLNMDFNQTAFSNAFFWCLKI